MEENRVQKSTHINMGSGFSTKVQEQFSGERRFFSPHGTKTIECPHEKKKTNKTKIL